MTDFALSRRIAAEFLGSWLLVATVVGSGIMGATLSPENAAIALLGNTIATGAILVVLIAIFGPISGAHFNPAVSLVFLLDRSLSKVDFTMFVPAQIVGGVLGTLTAHAMFDLPLVQFSGHDRHGLSQMLSEAIATFGLIAVILGCRRFRPDFIPFAVGLFIMAGYWFTASTSFANPAVTIARSLTDTFAGIRPGDAPWFILAQVIGALAAFGLFRWLLEPGQSKRSDAR
ncbi:MAG: MIP/aquaporin family protein [Dongiaceae bacterium]